MALERARDAIATFLLIAFLGLLLPLIVVLWALGKMGYGKHGGNP